MSLAENIGEAVELARRDPVWFVEEILRIKRRDSDPEWVNWQMDPWQVELIEAVADVWRYKFGWPTKVNHEGKNKISCRAMHGPGKTFGMALLMHLFGFCWRSKIPCTAPKLGQLQTRLWPEFQKIYQRAIPEYRDLMEVQRSKVSWRGDDGKFSMTHEAIQETASTVENLAGLHDDFMLFCIEEATGIPEALFPAIEGAMSSGAVVIMVMISNPTKNKGSFADSHLKEMVSRNYYTMHISLDKTTRVSLDWVQQMEDKYGPDSPVVKVRCRGEFADDDENQLISMQWITDAQNRVFREDGSLPQLRISADVSDGGQDLTEIIVSRHYDSVTHFIKKVQCNYPSAHAPLLTGDECIRLFDAYGGSKDTDIIIVDGLGVGAGAVGHVSREGYPVIRYVGGSGSDNPAKWRNRRVQSYMCLRDDFRDGCIVYADDFCDDADWDDYIGQLCSIKKAEGTGEERVEDLMTKTAMKRQGIKSPDGADASAMQYTTESPLEDFGFDEIIPMGQSILQEYDGGLA